MSFFDKIREGLKKTKEAAGGQLNAVLANFRSVDEELLEDLEDAMVMADMGAALAAETTEELRQRAKLDNLQTREQVVDALCDILAARMTQSDGLRLSTRPSVILVVGVNGVGKTTTIGKLGQKLTAQGKKVLFAAADTFRAAAADQLTVWSEIGRASCRERV